jgi:regulatory protein
MTDIAQDPQARLQHALDVAYRYLGRRERTVLEVRRHLEAGRIEPDTIATALEELAQAGYLDDARYARTFAEDRRTLDGWGAERIERRLRRAGIDRALIDAVLSTHGPDDELAGALAVLERRVRTPPQDERARERALGVLVRRGYDLDTAYDAVRRFEAGRAV